MSQFISDSKLRGSTSVTVSPSVIMIIWLKNIVTWSVTYFWSCITFIPEKRCVNLNVFQRLFKFILNFNWENGTNWEERLKCSVGLASAPYMKTRHITSSFSCYGRSCNYTRTFHGSDYDILHRDVLLWGSRAIYSKMFLRKKSNIINKRTTFTLYQPVWWKKNPYRTKYSFVFCAGLHYKHNSI